MLSIRMRRTGSKKRPFYRVVVTEGRTPREGSFLEILGAYNPRTKPATVEIDRDRVLHWIKQGARPSDSVRTLMARHLTRDRGITPTPVTYGVARPPAEPAAIVPPAVEAVVAPAPNSANPEAVESAPAATASPADTGHVAAPELAPPTAPTVAPAGAPASDTPDEPVASPS